MQQFSTPPPAPPQPTPPTSKDDTFYTQIQTNILSQYALSEGNSWPLCTVWNDKSKNLCICICTVPFQFVVVEIIDHLELEIMIDSHQTQIYSCCWHCFLLPIQILLHRSIGISIHYSKNKGCHCQLPHSYPWMYSKLMKLGYYQYYYVQQPESEVLSVPCKTNSSSC